MKLSGQCKIFKIEQNEKGHLVGRISFFNKTGRQLEDGRNEYETDFVSCRFVGEALKSLAQMHAMGVALKGTAIDVTESNFRHRNYKDKNGEYKTWTEVTIFDFQVPTPTTEKTTRQTFSF